MRRMPGRTPLGMTLSLVIAAACGKDRPEPQAEPPAVADTNVPAAAGETAKAPGTSISADNESSRSGGSRSGTGGPRRDTSGARPPARPATSPSPSEGGVTQLRGTITVVGNAPVTQVQLRAAGGGNRTLTGPELPSLRRIAGLEVALSGALSSDGELMVREFTVLSADGQPALDGVLEQEGNTLYLRTASGRVSLGNPPADFHNLVGARVWLTGSSERGPNAFGIITPAR
jgi:hypothetical protein